MNTQVLDKDDRLRSLDEFANVAPTNNNNLPAAPSVAAISAERIVGAQPVAVHRNETVVLQKLAALGAAAGDDWFYRFPVKNRRKGTTDYIEGPSIKLANDLARIYGNCEVQTRVLDLGASWLIYARFSDYETGFALERPFQQTKGGAKLGGDDDARRLDIALQIGVSKACRNVVVNALQTFADYAFDAARNSLVEKIGKNLQGYRDRVVQGIANQDIELVRVELVIGKPAKDWTAPDVARVIALMKGIADGMATVDETFPAREAEKSDAGAKLDQFANSGEKAGDGTDKGHGMRVNPDFGQTDSASKEYQDKVTGNTGEQPDQNSQTSDAGPTPSVAGDAKGGAEAGNSGQASNASSSPTPRTAEEYRDYAMAWIAEQTSAEECRARWSREKDMRKTCGVSATITAELDALMKARVQELKQAS
ncbi:hypothetical protein [Bradyrhizobium sp. Tv2a-2]|uniref:hypothetical protein n=1 Tax=Bradyrhizobium sp. Tv2a-2 TaxID=113395 RepID=UPI00040620E5|nr:hypothetical protein [Bradyrhizobium sp. Tv2a-2]